MGLCGESDAFEQKGTHSFFPSRQNLSGISIEHQTCPGYFLSSALQCPAPGDRQSLGDCV